MSKSQTVTTAGLFPGLFNKKAVAAFDLKIGRELVYAFGGQGKIETVTSSPRVMESHRPSFQIQNEVHHWLAGNDGHEMRRVMRRNASKRDSRILSLTNAFMPGEDSVAEKEWRALEAVASGRAPDTGIMYDSLEAPPEATFTAESIPLVLAKVRGDSIWLNIERLTKDMLDPETPVSESRRFFYNQLIASDEQLITEEEWRGILQDDLTLEPDDEIVLGFDGGQSDDSSALVAIRISDNAIFPVRVWEKPLTKGPRDDEGNVVRWEIDMEQVDGVVASTFARYKVRAFFSDQHPIESWVTKWSNQYRETVLIKGTPGKSAVGYDMRGNQQEITRMNEALVGAIRAASLKTPRPETSPSSAALRTHALNAFQRPNAWGMSFAKESRESPRKVDAYAATLLAYIALNKYLESGKKPAAEADGSFWFF